MGARRIAVMLLRTPDQERYAQCILGFCDSLLVFVGLVLVSTRTRGIVLSAIFYICEVHADFRMIDLNEPGVVIPGAIQIMHPTA